MRKIYLLFVGLVLSCSVMAQDWVNNLENLYYYGEEGKIYLEPDYTSSAVVYFSESPSENIKSFMLDAYTNAYFRSAKPFAEEDIKVMALKDIMEVKANSAASVETPEERAQFLESYGLKSKGAYDVLPKFQVAGDQVAFTKKLIIALKDGQNLNAISDIMAKYNATFVRSTSNEQTLVLEVSGIENQLPLIQEVYDKGLLKWGQPDFKVEITRFDDPLYPEQFQMNNTGGTLDGLSLVSDIDIDAPEAWAISTGSSSITVAVIDDGVEDHPDLPTILDGFTPATDGDGSPLSDGEHAESCAGIIAAQHNDIGVRGVAPGVNLLTVNIFEGSETVSDLAEAFDWAVEQGADVISNSWGFSDLCSTNYYPALNSAINDAVENGRNGLGCTVVFASGNDYGTCVSYPANIDGVIAVGAVSPDGDISLYSNQGSTLDVVAPSNDINSAQTALIYGVRSTDRTGSNGYSTGNYTDDFGGTSAACPAVAGVAALVLSIDGTLTSSEVYDIITSTADDMGSSGFDNTFGYGRVNAYEAVMAAGGGSSCDLDAPQNLTSSSVTDTSFQLTWSAVTDASYYTVTVAGSSSTTTSTSFVADDLASGTTYTCTVVANCSDGESGTASTISVTTSGSQTEDTEAPTTPGSLSTSGITSSSATLSWSASSDNVGVTSYNVYLDGSLEGTTTSTSYSLTGLSSSTSYTASVTAEDAAGNESSATSVSFTTDEEDDVTYCSSTGSNVTYEWIDLVQLGSISNSTGSNGGYGDFTSMSTSVAPGSTYTIYFSAGFASSSYREYWSVWIDFNHDGDFTDSGEQLVSGYSSSSGTLSASISIPSSATLGSTRMRVSMKWNSAPSACETFSYGEVEDYTVNISSSASSLAKFDVGNVEKLENGTPLESLTVYPNPVSDIVNIVVTDQSGPYSLTLTSLNGTTIKEIKSPGSNGEVSIDMSGMAEGIYLVVLKTQREVINAKIVK